MTLLLILCVALIVIGWWMIWQHDTSRNTQWHRNVWVVLGVCSVLIGVFGTLFALGEIY